jgi:hypothetical protein
MTITVGTCTQHIRAVLGGDPLAVYSGMFAANTVGSWLETAHSWEWLERATASLDVVGGQSWVELPAFREIQSIVPTNALTSQFKWTSMENILRLRNQNIGTQLVYRGALNYHAVAGGAPVQRLELWPTPSSDAAGLFTMHYKAAWAPLTDDNATIPVPVFMEQVFLLACVEWIKGMEEYASEESRGGSGYDRLERLKHSSLFLSAKQRDGIGQSMLGPLENGAAEGGGYYYDREDFRTIGEWGS